MRAPRSWVLLCSVIASEMESPRAAVISLDARRARCSGVREPLGDVFGGPMLTMALTGEKLQIGSKTTSDVRKEVADKARVSTACVCLFKGDEILCDDDHIYADDDITVIIASYPPATYGNLPRVEETFATPPQAPDGLGPCAFGFAGNPNDLIERLHAADAEVRVESLAWPRSRFFFSLVLLSFSRKG